jgi:hypothetical protein
MGERGLFLLSRELLDILDVSKKTPMWLCIPRSQTSQFLPCKLYEHHLREHGPRRQCLLMQGFLSLVNSHVSVQANYSLAP